jgi:hypothetical protein
MNDDNQRLPDLRRNHPNFISTPASDERRSEDAAVPHAAARSVSAIEAVQTARQIAEMIR